MDHQWKGVPPIQAKVPDDDYTTQHNFLTDMAREILRQWAVEQARKGETTNIQEFIEQLQKTDANWERHPVVRSYVRLLVAPNTEPS